MKMLRAWRFEDITWSGFSDIMWLKDFSSSCLIFLLFDCFGIDYIVINLGNRYQKLLALVGLISCLALWDVLKLCGDRWGLEQHPIIKQSLIRIAQCGESIFLSVSPFPFPLSKE